ncbi:endoplasmic reticulum vesicle transporter-domain-containing protein [Radiomyces spectabilis]|uniref:endoplasmic reticulum vesicle transporter-domain-containing protein n=1 Tax=Radiomyces spectabilis TaxID=64574 RepID=UPI00221EE4F4|nr:endoplasmic reticulum vesicle transporter-domain-containing protein [Radiomyces spectabilis]KAI8380935.1 endoplasmic reticulum vesicle transporter-domain-containing protein [Radiomyces spectabilis]
MTTPFCESESRRPKYRPSLPSPLPFSLKQVISSMGSNSWLHRFRRLDAYAKTLDDFRIRTATGATVVFMFRLTSVHRLVSLISAIVIAVLVIFEVGRYLTPEMHSAIIVDGGKSEKLPISFDITFPELPCYLLSLDVMDESGEHISGYEHDVTKVRLDAAGKEITKEKAKSLSNTLPAQDVLASDKSSCGDCYGANPKGVANPCCNTCEDVQTAYADMGWAFNPDTVAQCIREGWKEKMESQSHEGCRMHGRLLVNKVRGNFHFSPGRAFAHGAAHVHDVRSYLAANHNFKHSIHHLQFGDQGYQLYKQKRTKSSGLTNPLDGTEWGYPKATMMYQFFLKIVPTQFDYLNGRSLRTFQYSVSRHEQDLAQQPQGGLPERRISFASFMTSLCAIVGGIFTVAGIVDGILYRAERTFGKKAEMGKHL